MTSFTEEPPGRLPGEPPAKLPGEFAGKPPGKPPGKPRGLLRQERASFGYAFAGVGYAWATQRHLRIHAGLATLAVVLGLVLGLAPAEWALLCLTIAFVLALELLNTVVEAVVDLASPKLHPLAKVAKDVAAGAVLVGAAGGLLVGVFLFVPRLWRLVLLLISQ